MFFSLENPDSLRQLPKDTPEIFFTPSFPSLEKMIVEVISKKNAVVAAVVIDGQTLLKFPQFQVSSSD